MDLIKAGMAMLFFTIGMNAKASTPGPIDLPESLAKQLKFFEPSAALFLEDLNGFLISSDDTTEDDQPLLFLMDRNGAVEPAAVRIRGISKMTDIESLSQDESGTLYLMSSLSLNKNGRNKPERNILVRASRQGKRIQSRDAIQFRPLLLQALRRSPAPELQSMRPDLNAKMDIESHFIRSGNLFVGLKEPQPEPGIAVIVKAGTVENIFANEELDLEVWRTIDFASLTGEPDLLSDILVLPEKLLLSTTQENGPGRLWSFNESTGELELLEEFAVLRPEGLAYEPSQKALLTVFDQGEEEAYFRYGVLNEPADLFVSSVRPHR